MASYKLRELSKVWYIKWKENRPVKVGPIEWEELKELFLGMYFPNVKREVKVEKFIKHKKGNMSLEDYSLKFNLLSNYAPYLVSNRRDEMSWFMTGVSDLLNEECGTTMLYNDMNIYRLTLYSQCIEYSTLERLGRDLNRKELISKANLGLRRELQIKMFLVLLRLMLRPSK